MSSIKFTESENSEQKVPGLPVIKVIGLGGGGGNAVNFMKNSNIPGVSFICANTDAQALDQSPVEVCIQLGEGGLGAGAMPDRGRKYAEAHIEDLREQLQGVDMVFIAAGMGGGTGTGSAPVVARVAREMGILTVGVVSMPFSFERRMKAAQAGVDELAEHVDSLITVPNDKLMKVVGDSFDFAQAFDYANEVLSDAVLGITELVTRPGLINVDFEDLRTVMTERGVAMMGAGIAEGDDRAIKATQKAIANPLLEDIEVQGARGLLVNITSGNNLTLGEFNQVGSVIDEIADPDAVVIIGTSVDSEMTDEVRVTVVATGLNEANKDKNLATLPKAKVNPVRPAETQTQPVPEQPQAAQPTQTSNAYGSNAQVATGTAQQDVAAMENAAYQSNNAPAQPYQTHQHVSQQAPQQTVASASEPTIMPAYQQPSQMAEQLNADQGPSIDPMSANMAANTDSMVQAQQVNGHNQASAADMLDIPAFIRRQLD